MAKFVSPTYGVKFPEDVDTLIRAQAARTDMSKTEVVRHAATQSLTQPSTSHLLKQLELNLLRHTFEMNCIIVGLNPQQRQQALRLCNNAFGQEVLA